MYTCDPQGLKGTSEQSYEKLSRIYGDIVQNGRLAQMADGLHVFGQTVHELASNYVEVLNRAEICNFTFKPSKVIVYRVSSKYYTIWLGLAGTQMVPYRSYDLVFS